MRSTNLLTYLLTMNISEASSLSNTLH